MAEEKKRSTATGGTQRGRHARPSPPLFSTRKRLSTWQKATALVPLALLSGAWTTSMTMAGQSADAAGTHVSRLPDGTPIPNHPLKKPASVTAPGSLAPAVPSKQAAQAVASSVAPDGIPEAALSAYRHAADVIDRADPSCHLPWQLLAAIGRVESDHGQYGGNVLGTDGVARPGIYGIPLDGSGGTADIADTDGGRFDGDPVYDRAVGPMQFIPSTWSVVGVDGDGDGVKNPQDINDAALGAAVYLCAGHEDLATQPGRAAAVYRYNHNDQYVQLVLSIMKSYLDGDYTAAPDGVAAPAVLSSGTHTGKHRAAQPRHHHAATTGGRHRAGGTHTRTGGSGGTSPAGSGGGTGGTSGGDSTPTLPAPTKSPTGTATQVTQPVVDTIDSTQEAVSFCTANLPSLSSLSSADQQTVINDCASKIVGMTKDQAAKAIPDTLDGVLNWLGLTGILDGLLGGSSGSGGGLLGGGGGLLGGS